MNAINTTELNKLLTQLEMAIPQFQKKDASISNSNVGWHIAHSLMVINGIIETTSKSKPADYKWSFNLKRLVVFAKKKIPRGIAKAPKSVLPKDVDTIESLTSLLEKAKLNSAAIVELDKAQFFNHPGFGNIKLKQTVRFLAIHTNHHLDIIKDILESEKF
jgi:hypothetical protein